MKYIHNGIMLEFIYALFISHYFKTAKDSKRYNTRGQHVAVEN